MLKSAIGKVLWVGRAAATVFGLALVLALVFGVASAALAGNLDPLKIGSLKNVATKTTALVGKVATGSALVVNNPSGGSALGLQVNAGRAPLTVNPEAGTATNLDADKLDGLDSSDLKASCPAETQPLAGGGCIETTVREKVNLPTARSLCAGLGGRLPTGAELDAYRQQPNVTVGSDDSPDEWTGDLVRNSSGDNLSLAMRDTGEYFHYDQSASVALRCVFSPS